MSNREMKEWEWVVAFLFLMVLIPAVATPKKDKPLPVKIIHWTVWVLCLGFVGYAIWYLNFLVLMK